MNILEEIVAYKKTEVEKSKEKLPLEKLKKLISQGNIKNSDFTSALKAKISKKEIALITEIKKASPSKGIIKKDFNHIEIAKAYKNGGATCLSVLTDEKYFQGNLNYIKEIKEFVDLPVLRKDFIIDSYQIYESINSKADCVLLIVSALDKETFKKLFDISCENNVCTLIEVHNEREMEACLELNPKLIGINNRNLKTFNVTLDTTKSLVQKYKRDLTDKIIVSESGIFTVDDIKELTQFNIFSFLIGEGLLVNSDIEKATRNLLLIKQS